VTSATADTVSGRIKQAVSVLEFVSQFVDLSARGIGKCPFRADQHESFAVNDRSNYWNCFAGCGGGSVIDYWMKRQGCNFTTAVTELASLLL
jgi:DNA primase